MMIRTVVLALSLTLITAPAWADVVFLRNGRKLEGEITKATPTKIKLRMSWGVMTIPRSRIKTIKQQTSAKKEFLLRLKTTDVKDPAALKSLAEWAAKRGLGTESSTLDARSRELLYERRVASAKKRKSVEGWIGTYHWARSSGITRDRQLFCIEQARQLAAPGDRKVAVAMEHLRGDIAAEEALLKRQAEAARGLHYAMPENQTYKKRAGELVSISGKTTLAAMMKPEQNRKKMLARLAAYQRAAAALPKSTRTDPRDQVKDTVGKPAQTTKASKAAKATKPTKTR